MPRTAMNPRSVIRTAIVALCSLGFFSNCFAETDFHQLKIQPVHGEFQNATVKVQYDGIVAVIKQTAEKENDDEATVSRLPLDVTARFAFDQQINGSTANLQVIRYYHLAEANLKVGKGKSVSKLDPQNNYVLGRLRTDNNHQNQFQLVSIGHHLQQKEYELLKHPGDPMTLFALIDKSAKVGEVWHADRKAFGRFLAVDRAINSDVKLKLKSVENGIAKVQFAGKLKGEVDDVITEIDARGEINLNIKQKSVVSVRIFLNQVRDPGQIAPGFEGQVKVDIKVKSINDSNKLRKPLLDAIVKKRKGSEIKNSFLLAPEGSEFQLVHSPRWRTIASQKDAAILRYVENGDLLAQCNIVELPKRPADKPLTLEEFKKEIEKIVGESKIKINSTNEAKTKNGLHAIRVVASGLQTGVEIRWHYYHVTNPDGRRLTFVFTLEEEMANRFATADQSLVNQVAFMPVERQSKLDPNATQRKSKSTSLNGQSRHRR